MITEAEISALESSVNEILRKHNMSFKMSKHFVKDRMNDSRNTPMIMIAELNSIFNRLTARHKENILNLKHNSTFNIRCTISHINMPCAVNKIQSHSGEHHENIVITVMRKAEWKSKDSAEFLI
ncbi:MULTISPECIES: hypothetical protein [unclassified Pseudoalteromonas]|uniref:hypothetical protein n=1 Tax=unclassified Pseudoalteromonas TaxID=194690 RepID=UPI0006D6850F|nr:MULTISPECIES: hypothetical protein [unclassified Pseudoalteromonas]KPZ57487.1 hypothetical protein AN393_00738 [Pseudoalteromonas sp. P1-25]KPZ62365.1 hypothetical protein AN389_00817 [Pseudoalteromonas sp. P1-7a]